MVNADINASVDCIVPFTGTGIKAEPYEGDKPIKPESYPSWVRGLKNGGRKDEQRRI